MTGSIDAPWAGGLPTTRATDDCVAQVTSRPVALADKLGIASLAFPLIGAGSGRMREDAALARMLWAFEPLDSPLAATLVRFRR